MATTTVLIGCSSKTRESCSSVSCNAAHVSETRGMLRRTSSDCCLVQHWSSFSDTGNIAVMFLKHGDVAGGRHPTTTASASLVAMRAKQTRGAIARLTSHTSGESRPGQSFQKISRRHIARPINYRHQKY